MQKKSLFKLGIVGTVVTGICCFTPVLVVLLGAVGLSAWLAWSDAVLIPLLVVFVAITVFAAMGLVSAARHGKGEDESTE